MNKKVVSLLFVLVIVGSMFVRGYHFRDHLTFQSDQGRDAMIAKRILTEADIALIGPVTSVGNMYLGPLYYYFMVPFLAVTYPDPSGPAYAIAILSILTVAGVFWVGKRIFNPSTAIIASLFCGFMGTAITYSRFSWNPNIAPFLGLLLFFASYYAHKTRSIRWWIVVGLVFSMLLQSHYVALSLAPALVILYLHSLATTKNKRSLMYGGLGAVAVIVVSLLPLAVFDIRHNGIISSGFGTFFTSNEEHIRPLIKISQTLRDLELRSWLILAQLMVRHRRLRTGLWWVWRCWEW
jgi:4-amino-4-deoxy-L-arabinose transferase-like glycosyltransferase